MVPALVRIPVVGHPHVTITATVGAIQLMKVIVITAVIRVTLLPGAFTICLSM